VILTGPEIAREVALQRIQIEDFDPARIEPNSYGFRLAPEILRYPTGCLDAFIEPAEERTVMTPEGMVLLPDNFYLGATREAMGSPHYAATLYARRSVSTLGMWIQFSAPLGHCGAIIPWTLEIKVAQPLRVFPDMLIGKIAFWAMQGDPIWYKGKYSGSDTVVASRLSQERR
jgi:dCTP deaminase